VPRGKPYPDVFLEAARRIGAAADCCLAFEDAPAGIVAARDAGMATVAVSTSYPREVLAETRPAPHWVVGDFAEFLAGPGAWLPQAAGR
jgi:beta-phosphoglucomutase